MEKTSGNDPILHKKMVLGLEYQNMVQTEKALRWVLRFTSESSFKFLLEKSKGG